MTSSVSLSVIVPTYNRSAYVRTCLTALAASGVADLEVIVSDDGSTDDTRDVVAATNPAAVYLWHPNSGGPVLPRNRAFAISRGRYVAFLDCDDQWLPGVPARAAALLDRHPEVDVLFADARMGNEAEGYQSWIAVAGQDAFFKLPHRVVEPGFRILERGPFFRRTAERSPLFIGAMILRREAFSSSGGFDPKLRGAADWDLWLRLAARHTFGYLAEPLAIYTRHRENMSSDHDHMVGEFCQALSNVLAAGYLASEDAAVVRRRLRHERFHHAYLAYDAGHFGEARARFGRAIRAGSLGPRTLAYFAACCLPASLTRGARRAKQSLPPDSPDASRAP